MRIVWAELFQLGWTKHLAPRAALLPCACRPATRRPPVLAPLAGALAAHDGLWESAAETAHSLAARLAIEVGPAFRAWRLL